MDLHQPTLEELRTLQRTYGLHDTSINDCFEPGHLPKYEKVNGITFMIVRAFDECSSEEDDNIRSITKKISLFLGDRFLITVHRQEVPFLTELIRRYQDKDEECYLQVILLEIMMEAAETYHSLLEAAETRIESFEMAILGSDTDISQWAHIFRTKCRLSVTKRMLWHSMNTVQKFVPQSSSNLPICQDLRERIESLQFFTDGLIEDLSSIQSIQLSLSSHSINASSHKTNEVMRLLTVFSLFFLPINFVVGVYGMNFEYMPELKYKLGYPAVWIVIVAIELTIFLWVKRRGWLKRQEL